MKDQFVAFEPPCALGLLLGVSWSNTNLEQLIVVLQFETSSPSRPRKIVVRWPEHHLRVRIFFTRMHPLLKQSFPVDSIHLRYSNLSFYVPIELRGPSNVADIRDTCPEVNMTIESSST